MEADAKASREGVSFCARTAQVACFLQKDARRLGVPVCEIASQCSATTITQSPAASLTAARLGGLTTMPNDAVASLVSAANR